MARTILPLAGAIIGNIIAPGIGAKIGWVVGSLVGSVVDPQVNPGPKLGELQVQTSRDGGARAIIYGTPPPIAGNVIARGEFEKVIGDDGGKGAPQQGEPDRVFLDYAVGLGEGPIVALSRVWENGKIVYDARATGDFAADSAKWLKGVTIYLGDETQMPDPTLEAIFGVGTTPAYRGTIYIVHKRRDLTEMRGAIPQGLYEVTAAGTVTDPGTSGFWLIKAGNDNDTLYTTNDGFVTYSAAKTRTPNINGQSLTYAGFAGQRVKVNYSHTGSELIVAPAVLPTTVPTTTSTTIGAGGRIRRFTNLIAAHGGAGTGASAAVTLDGGITWLPIPVPYVAVNNFIYDISRLNSGRWVVLAPDSSGSTYIWHSDEQVPTTWTKDSKNPTGGACDTLCYNGINLVVTGATVGDRCWTLQNDLQTWTSRYLGATAYNEASDCINDGLVFWICTGYNKTTGGAVMRSLDNGETWDIMWTGDFRPLRTMSIGGGLIVAGVHDVLGGTGKVLVSANNGVDWVLRDTPWNTFAATSMPFWAGPITPTIPVVEGDQVSVASIVADLCARVGIPAGKIDTSLLLDTCRGYVVGGHSVADAIRGLQRPFLFDAVEYDKKIHFLPRGRANVFDFTLDDLLDGETPEEAEREQEFELPRVLHLMYSNPELSHEFTKQTSRRTSPDLHVRGELTIEVSVSLHASEAASLADRMHKVAWIDLLGEVRIPIPARYSYLTPTDCGTLTWNGATRRLRIEQVELADGRMQLQLRHDRQSAYNSTAVSTPALPPAPPVSTVPGETVLYLMNLPALIDAHDKLGIYAAGAGELSGWSGARLQQSLDEGSTWNDVTAFSPGTVMGYLKNDLPSHNPHYMDTTNTLRVLVIGPSAEFDSLSRSQLLQERNAIAILAADGTAEIVQFQDAVDEGDGIWALTNLIRGGLATPPAHHYADSRFALLDGARFLELGAAAIGQVLRYRAPAFETTPDEADVETLTWQPAHSQREFAPAYLAASRVGAVVSAFWIPRHRFGSDVNPVPSINFAGYRITITGSTGSVTFDQTTSTVASYNAAAVGTPTSFAVAGINHKTGVGASSTVAL